MDREECARLAEKFAPSVYRLAYARTGAHADAEDIMQDVFLRLLTKAPDFTDDDHAKAWLLKVTANRAGDLFRAARRRDVPLEDAAGLESPAKPPIPGEAVEAVLALPPKLRVVVHLFYYEELPVAEVARLLGLRESAVKVRLFRARALLRQSLLKGEEHNASG